MTDTSTTPETPDVAEVVSFLRRFAGLMANGDNARFLGRAADLLDSLTVRVGRALEEDELWRHKYEALTRHAGALETECDALRTDVEGHLDATSAILAERDAVGATLKAREAELSESREAFSREQRERAAESAANEEALAALRLAFDQKREALQVQLDARGDELAAFRIASERELDALKAKVASLEAERTELRSAFDRINDLNTQAQAGADPLPAQWSGPGSAAGESNAVVPKTTLRQARAQFEYLAREFIPLGDIASQVMCELGAYTMDLALVAGQPTEHLPVGEVAWSILGPRQT